MSEELDSQLSAMFDDELPQSQCELLARRLARDESLKARWGRYAVMRAAMRTDESAYLVTSVARNVRRTLASEADLPASASATVAASRGGPRWWYPVAGTAVAGVVAAISVLWLRQQSPLESPSIVAESVLAEQEGSTEQSAAAQAGAGPVLSASNTDEAGDAPGDLDESYTVPVSREISGGAIVPTAELANYVVAHSEFSSPLSRRNLLSALVASEAGTAGVAGESDERTEDSNIDAQTAAP